MCPRRCCNMQRVWEGEKTVEWNAGGMEKLLSSFELRQVPAHRPITSSQVMLTFGSEIHSELISMSLLFPPLSLSILIQRTLSMSNLSTQHRNSMLNLGLKMYHTLASEVQGWCGVYRVQGFQMGLCIWYVSLPGGWFFKHWCPSTPVFCHLFKGKSLV